MVFYQNFRYCPLDLLEDGKCFNIVDKQIRASQLLQEAEDDSENYCAPDEIVNKLYYINDQQQEHEQQLLVNLQNNSEVDDGQQQQILSSSSLVTNFHKETTPTTSLLTFEEIDAKLQATIVNSNYMKPEEILNAVNYYRNARKQVYDKCKLNVNIIYTDFNVDKDIIDPTQDGIYILELKNTPYILFVNGKQHLIIDGNNYVSTYEKDVIVSIGQLVGLKNLAPLKYEYQSRIDHCGSSAVIIILRLLEFSRLNNNKSDISMIGQMPDVKRQLIARYHPVLSEVIEENIGKYWGKVSCEFCGQRFASRSRANGHKGQCLKRKQTICQ